MADTAQQQPDETVQHSVALAGTDGDRRLFAPAAARNSDAIWEALAPHLPDQGTVLEIASGTGEHVVTFAAKRPTLNWQPTDIEPERLASISAWIRFAGVSNVAEPVSYDVVNQTWPGPACEAVFLCNLLHLISGPAAKTALNNMASALKPRGKLAIYGPFLRGATYASEGDERFDQSIKSERLDAGYKDIGWVETQLAGAGLQALETKDMPANNLLTMWEKP